MKLDDIPVYKMDKTGQLWAKYVNDIRMLLNYCFNISKYKMKKRVTLFQESSQGDFAELFCKMPMDNVPASTLSGQTSSERVLNIYTRLKEFQPHLKTVQDQQEDLLPSLLESLSKLRGHLDHLASRVDSIFHTLQPNVPMPEPPARTLPAQNSFQQKVYGCVVLTRLGEFLSTVVDELRSLKSSMCTKRSGVMSQNYWAIANVCLLESECSIYYLIYFCTYFLWYKTQNKEIFIALIYYSM